MTSSSASRLRSAVDAARRGSDSSNKFREVVIAAAPSAAAVAAKKYGQSAFDMAGREHDLAELRERRNAAVVKGLRKMFKFFRKENYAPLYEIGDDAPSIFFECWYTSANSAIRMESKAICKKLMPKYEQRLLEECGHVPPPPTAIELATVGGSSSSAAARGADGGGSTPSLASLGLQQIARQRRSGSNTRMRLTQVIADASKGAASAGAASAPARVLAQLGGQRTDVGSQDGSAKDRSGEGDGDTRPSSEAKEEEEAKDDDDEEEGGGEEEGEAEGGEEQSGGSAAQSVAARARAAFAARKKAEDAEEVAIGDPECEEEEGADGPTKKRRPAGKAKGGGGGGSGGKKKKERPNRPDRDDFFAIMFLARCKHEMGEETTALLERADVAWKTHGFADTDKLFAYKKDALLSVGIDDWLMLLMRIMIMEYNHILFARRYRLQWGLKDALIALRSIPLTPPPRAGEDFSQGFHDSFYLATHIVYVQSAYNAIKADQREIPWLYRYVRQSFRFWMRQVKLQKSDPSVYVDIDGIGEICDCLRGCGMTEASDPMLCEGTLYMLRTQRKNGFWPAVLPGEKTPEADLDYYHRVHPTWVCTQALRDRDFKIGSNAFWPDFIAKVLKESQFTTLDYKPGW